MIRLTKHDLNEHQAVVRLDGRFTADALPQFRGVLPPLARSAVTIDLSGVTFLDGPGRAFLLGLREAGCRLEGGSLYITRLLEEA